jgi:hypothetical protein
LLHVQNYSIVIQLCRRTVEIMICARVVVVIISAILTGTVECGPSSGHHCYVYTTAVPTHPYIMLYRGYYRTQDVANTCGPFLFTLHNLHGSSVRTAITSIDNRIAHPCLSRVSKYSVRDTECSTEMYAKVQIVNMFFWQSLSSTPTFDTFQIRIESVQSVSCHAHECNCA